MSSDPPPPPDQQAALARRLIDGAATYAVIGLDPGGRITAWSRGAERLLGWSEAEAVGQPGSVIFTPEDREAGTPERELDRARREGAAEDVRWHVKRDGSRFWGNGVLTRLEDGSGFVKITRDWTEQHETGRALRASEQRFRLIVESATEYAIFTTDLETRITSWNTGAERLLGYAEDEAVGRSGAMIFTAEDREHGDPEKEIEEALATGRSHHERWHVRRDGTRLWGSETLMPMRDEAGEPRGFLKIVRDRTEEKRAEDALRGANATLEARADARTAELRQALDALHAEALERAQAEAQLRQAQKMEAVGQLTGGIAHDFNNMLQAIGGGLDMVRRRVAQGRAAEAGRYMEGARETVQRAAALTHRLLAFARRQALQPRLVEPDRLVEGMAELIRRTMGSSIEVELRTRDGLGSVLCDPNQLENVLLNLAINARDAMPEGGRLSIGTEDVSLSAADVAGQEGAEPGGYVEISVADTGTGMDEATRERAFEPFFTTKPLGQGTGLRLSQAYGFVRQSEGIARLDSAPGQGTTVRLYLPRRTSSAVGEEAGPARADAPAAGVGETVLLVEDEAGVRALAAEHLRELGYEVLEAEDGPAALRVLHGSRSGDVDLLVTDVGLPRGLNGRQVAEMARERLPGLPVLFITGYAGSALDGGLAPGMAVIGKPFALDALAAKVRDLIEGKRVSRS